MSIEIRSTEIRLDGVDFSFGDTPILKGISFHLQAGESAAWIGASGCGKSTLLNLIAGDHRPSKGSVRVQGQWRRVWQTSSLFPWLTVEENIRLGLRGVHADRALDFRELVTTLDLHRSLDLYPRQLSGGMRQRTEIARALIGRPDGLLLDEPFSALDSILRRETREYLLELLRRHPISLVLVTHDIAEAIAMARRVIILKGRPASIAKEYQTQTQSLSETIWSDLKEVRP